MTKVFKKTLLWWITVDHFKIASLCLFFFLPTYYRKRRFSINFGLSMYSWFIGNLRCRYTSLEWRCKLYFEVPLGKHQKYKVKMTPLVYNHVQGQSQRKQKCLDVSKGRWGGKRLDNSMKLHTANVVENLWGRRASVIQKTDILGRNGKDQE